MIKSSDTVITKVSMMMIQSTLLYHFEKKSRLLQSVEARGVREVVQMAVPPFTVLKLIPFRQ